MKLVVIYFLVLAIFMKEVKDKGYGFSFNIPVDAFTEDESWLTCYKEALSEVAAFFKPDVILTQNGADAHYFGPIDSFICDHENI